LGERSQDAHDAGAEIARALRPEGWTVVATPTETGVRIAVDHPVSIEHGFNLPRGHEEQRRFVSAVLGLREFAVVAQRPSRLDNAPLLRSVREAATAQEWKPNVISAVARLLERHGILSEDESRWLEAAGLAWEET
jgi:hypothetical protein